MLIQDITGKASGRIWAQKSLIRQDNGIRAVVAVSGTGLKVGKCHRFLHAAFVCREEKIIAGDHLGVIYHLDISNNRFSVIQNTGQACTCIATGLKSQSEYLVAVADTSIKCYAIESKEMISWMRGHSKTVHTISVHESGTLAISSSEDTAQLWDLENFERKRKLTVASETPIQKVFFLPSTNVIITCFKDNTVFGWDVYTLDWKFQLKSNSHAKDFNYKEFAVTSDGKLVVAAGRSNSLHIYSLDSLELVRIIQLSNQISSVKTLEFLPDRFAYNGNKILGVLSSEGTMTFIDIKSCNPVFQLTPPVSGDKLMNVAVSSSGNHIAATTVGGLLVIYDTLTLCSELNKAPDPLVKVVGNVWKKKSTGKKSKASLNPNRLNNRSISSGRIRCRKFHSERDELISSDDILPNGLSKQRLLNVLREYGEYPEQYRMFIWRSLLQLPENHIAFSALVAKSTHPAFANLDDHYPLKSRRLEHILQKILSALAHWSTIFGELDYLPFIVFPFIKLFQNNHLTCFEIVASFVVNWCQHWFEFFPNPPISVLAIVENVLAHHDKKLIRHFVKFNITSQIYAWPLLQSLFTEVFTRTEWLKFFDHVFSNDPSFMLYAVAAYCIMFHSTLLQTCSSDDIKYFFHHQNALDFEAFIKETYHLADSTPGDICIKTILDPFSPLSGGPTYPVFNKYPRFVVNYQAQEREKIKKNELEYLEERKMIEEMTKEIPDMNLEAEMLYQNQELLIEAERRRRKLLNEEKEKYVERKSGLNAIRNEVERREKEMMDVGKIRSLQHEQFRKESEIKRMEDEIQRLSILRDEQSSTAGDILWRKESPTKVRNNYYR